MTLYSRDLFRRLRHGTRREVKTRPEWREEARRIRRGRWSRHHDLGALRWIGSIFFAGLAMMPHLKNFVWPALTLWAVLLTLLRAAQFQHFCTDRNGCIVFIGLPISPRQVFDLGWGRVWRTSLWLGVDALAVLGTVIYFDSRSLKVWGALPGAILIWLSLLASTAILLWRWPRAAYDTFSSYLIVLLVAVGFALGRDVISTSQTTHVLAAFSWATPPGWACQLASWMTGEQPTFPVVAAGLLALLLAGAVPCFRAGADRFYFWEPDVPLAALVPFDDDAGNVDLGNASTQTENAREDRASNAEQVNATEALVRSRVFLAPFANFKLGWIERLVASRLRGQAATLDFLLAESPVWSTWYRLAWICLAAGALLILLTARWLPDLTPWIGGGSIFLTVALSTPLFGGQWPGFGVGVFGQRAAAVLALLPVSLREVRQVVLVVNAWRFVLALPCWLGASLLLGCFFEFTLPGAIRLGMEVWLILLLLQPFFLVFKYSQGTNDTSSGFLNVTGFYFGGFVVAGGVGAVIFAIAFQAAILWQGAAFAILAGITFGFEAAYRRLYASQRIDLLAKMGSMPSKLE